MCQNLTPVRLRCYQTVLRCVERWLLARNDSVNPIQRAERKPVPTPPTTRFAACGISLPQYITAQNKSPRQNMRQRRNGEIQNRANSSVSSVPSCSKFPHQFPHLRKSASSADRKLPTQERIDAKQDQIHHKVTKSTKVAIKGLNANPSSYPSTRPARSGRDFVVPIAFLRASFPSVPHLVAQFQSFFSQPFKFVIRISSFLIRHSSSIPHFCATCNLKDCL
jgi:hypothetical protein